MGTRSLILTIFCLLWPVAAQADIQLTPKAAEYELEGIKFKRIAFSDGTGNEITYQQPEGWDYSGNATQLTLHPPKTAQAEGTITKVTLSQAATFDADTMLKLVQEVMTSVPSGSTNVTLVSQERNPVLIGRKETFLVTVSYTFYGENFKRSMMFLNRDHEQLRFQFVSRAGDFKDLQKAFLASQFTWHNL